MPDDTTVTGPVAAGPRLRVSDAERAETVRRLQHALVEGRLDLDETDERVTAAFAARYDGELEALLADLPPPVPTADGAPVWTEVWASAVWRARVLVLGADAGGQARPTPRQCRSAAALAALATLWMVLWAFVGAAMVA